MSETPEYRIRSNAPFALDRPFDNALTVAAWVESATARAEAMQPLVSQWRPRAAFDAFDAYDAGHTDGLVTQGYFGAVFDGRYAYFCPIRDRNDRTSVHGRVLRLDTHAEFKDPDAWAAYDASHTDGLHTAGFYGGAFDGRYVYFNPRDDGIVHHTRLLRYDTYADFKDPAAWAAHDAQVPHSGQGLASDGRYLYCCPGYTRSATGGLDDEPSGHILRYDTTAPLKDPASYAVFNAQQLSPEAACFDGAAFDGRHIYFAPLTSGHVLRYAVAEDFADPQSWDLYDARPLGMQMNVGAVFDGRHLYFCAYGNSSMVRYDTAAPFDEPAAWQTYVPVANSGFDGGFFDGRYIYYVPFTRAAAAGESVFHGSWLRYDTAAPFDDPAAWQTHDASYTDGLHTTAYNAGAFDGRYFYTAPWRGARDGHHAHGRVLRYDTLGTDGAFSLRYGDVGHNGGLCAAVPGPCFIVNTPAGAVSVAAHQTLAPGVHHLAGVYDGARIQLYIDGTLAASRPAGGRPLQQTTIPLTIGHIAGGSARFQGTIAEVYLSPVAQSAAWVAATYHAGPPT